MRWNRVVEWMERVKMNVEDGIKGDENGVCMCVCPCVSIFSTVAYVWSFKRFFFFFLLACE